MSLIVGSQVILATTSEVFEKQRARAEGLRDETEFHLGPHLLTNGAAKDLHEAATKIGDKKSARALDAIMAARESRFDKSVPSFKAFEAMLVAYLASELIDGWIYVRAADGHLYPELITEVGYDPDRRSQRPMPAVYIKTAAYSISGLHNPSESVLKHAQGRHCFGPQDVVRRNVADILTAAGLYKETASLKAEYEASLERYQATIAPKFAEQFLVTGQPYTGKSLRRAHRVPSLIHRRVINDLHPAEQGPLVAYMETAFAKEGEDSGSVPLHPLVRVFDLRQHEGFWVHGDSLTPYCYDKTLGEKLVLPASHRDLLDVLTTNLGSFVNDFVEGKSAGNVILCKGVPGVGKTLTAEVYAELIERPLYAIHSGTLGTDASTVHDNLQHVFERAKRWDCVLLLDEADVFVVQRGGSIEQNAVVAEFLRSLEYFDGLLFMTTNRPNDIDEAIISRCAAIVHYQEPDASDAALIWQVMASQFKVELGHRLTQSLVQAFPGIAPRDIKMLFRLALRVSAGEDEELSMEIFRRCAMFRAIPCEARSEPRDADQCLAEDISISTYRAPGQGGFSTSDPYGIALFHRPTGVEVRSHEARSAHANRAKCQAVLKAFLNHGPR